MSDDVIGLMFEYSVKIRLLGGKNGIKENCEEAHCSNLAQTRWVAVDIQKGKLDMHTKYEHF